MPDVDVSTVGGSGARVPAAPSGDDRPASRYLRRSAVAAVAVLAILNLTDVVSTTVALSLSARNGIRLVEGNPLARLLIPEGRVEILKLVVIAALALNTVRRPVTVGIHAALWAVVGIYAATIVNNLAAIATMR